LRNGPDFRVKFQRAALSSLIKNATSVKITETAHPLQPLHGILHFPLYERLPFFSFQKSFKKKS